jgi:surfeit locus 1 family protein
LHNGDYPVNLPGRPTPSVNGAASRKDFLRWLLPLLVAFGVAVTASLGTWQLRRAATKEALASQIEERNKLPALTDIAPVATNSVANGIDAMTALVHRRVRLRGTWLAQHTVFLDNRYMDGRPGFFVVTPLQLNAGPAVVWVQRGWVPRDPQDRTRLPELPLAPGSVTVQGRVIQEVSRVYGLGEPESALGAARASRIWQNLPAVDVGAQAQWLPLAVLQTTSSDNDSAASVPDGLRRDWPAVDSGVAKHHGYAFQWFALCGLIIVLYVWFQFIAPRRRKA